MAWNVRIAATAPRKPTMLEIEIDGTKYGWEHISCRCSGHCNSDKFYVDGEWYGRTDNPELCSFVSMLIEEVKRLKENNNAVDQSV
jgi:(2Fe-2S) ferredoxin